MHITPKAFRQIVCTNPIAGRYELDMSQKEFIENLQIYLNFTEKTMKEHYNRFNIIDKLSHVQNIINDPILKNSEV